MRQQKNGAWIEHQERVSGVSEMSTDERQYRWTACGREWRPCRASDRSLDITHVAEQTRERDGYNGRQTVSETECQRQSVRDRVSETECQRQSDRDRVTETE